ncbi:MAG: type III-A CRISPR-associated RAMP protein Csm4 [Candidatus Geothermincolales bacterium]
MLRLVRILPRAPFHLGEATGAMDRVSEVLHSDTLFSGICHCWSMLFGPRDLESLLESMLSGEPPFRISSGFPFVEYQGDTIYFLPAPRNLQSLLEAEGAGDHESIALRKKVKGLRFISVKRYLDLLGPDGAGKFFAKNMKALLGEKEILENSVGKGTRISAALDRRTMSAQPYFVSGLFFGRGSGAYVLLEGSEEGVEKALAAMRLLGDTGLGGDRASGYGQFELEEGDPSPFEEIRKIVNGGGWLCMSLLYPSDADRQDIDRSSVYLVDRKGWVSSPQVTVPFRRKRLFLVGEGSVLARELKGELVDVTPDGWPGHPVYRYGLSFLVPALIAGA